MARSERILKDVLGAGSDANVRFDDLRNLLSSLGFKQRTRGSHHLFSRSGVVERVNLQRDGNHAKPYQVRQVRRILLKYGLAGEE
ncbi:MAG: type II toxin-antitoxin system HicA family toxin [Acidobacteria bacterium]|nr:type II toxin-antitoxin system HicA family toxin [Acidobacteriota bacterium]